MNYAAIVVAILTSLLLGGCFSSLLSNYEVPKDITSKQCRVAADCTDNGGGGGS